MKKLILLILLICCASLSAQMADYAQIENINNRPAFGLDPSPTPFSLIDLSRIKWSNSYSVSFFSGGYGSGSLGMLNTGLEYEFSSKLSLAINVGIAHNPGSLFNSNTQTDARLLPGFMLDYHPSENFRMSIGMQTYQTYGNPYNYNNPYYYSDRYYRNR